MTRNIASFRGGGRYQLVIYLLLLLCAWGLPGQSNAAGACEPWVGKIVSLQGRVEVVRTGKARWQRVSLEETFCPGDRVRIEARSRAAIFLRNETVLRLNAGTTINFQEFEPEKPSVLEIIKGVVHFISRVPRTLKINTPFVNAAIEGTELLVRVDTTETAVWVFEGQVLVSNAAGSLRLSDGQSATAEAGKAPIRRLIIKPRDAVQWALYYPPIIDTKRLKTETSPGSKIIQQALTLYRANELPDAIAKLDALPATDRTAQFYTLRAGLLLSSGGVDEARKDIAQAIRLNPDDGIAHALQSIIALAQNENDKAFHLAKQATELDPKSPVPQIALSYAHQAMFDIKKARKSVKKAIDLAPDDALAWARLSELELSLGYLDRALAAARKAVDLDPNLERTQTVLGFAHLTQIRISEAQAAFRKAIELDSAAHLPRLGLGLATIRQGDLRDGTREIEIAASLDPGNSLIRSYLGKAYYEQKREKLAATEYAIAKKLDPKDPTPYFYDAILKQTTNRPVEALQDLQKAIKLNNNRAVYRSRLLLDQDLAARTASVARIYDDLNFPQRALLEGWKSINRDPSNYSGHRFLADTYSAIPRQEIARASELLQAQLLQPINITPVQPQQVETNLLILDGAGPGNPSFNEFNPLFARNRFALQATGVVGSDSTYGNEAILSGLQNRISGSLGQFHYQTKGFRDNSDVRENVLNAFFQTSVTHQHDLQAEIRYRRTNAGDTIQRIKPNSFSPNLRRDIDETSYRLGYHFNVAPRSDVLASIVYRQRDTKVKNEFDRVVPPLGLPGVEKSQVKQNLDAFNGELQYIFGKKNLNLIAGTGYYQTDNKVKDSRTLSFNGRSITRLAQNNFEIHNYSIYLYTLINVPKSFTWTVGFSGDFFDDNRASKFDRTQPNPKIGLTWDITSKTTLRLAAFRTLKRPLAVNQTVEPTQVAGFNQFFDDFNGTEAYNYGAGLDQKLTSDIFAGLEFSKRDLTVPKTALTPDRMFRFFKENHDEELLRAYAYWTPSNRVSLRAEYYYEHLSRDIDDAFARNFLSDPKSTRTHRVPFGIDYYHPGGLFISGTVSYVDQDVKFLNPTLDNTDKFSEEFWLFDTSIGYRLPKRFGRLTLSFRNLTDEDFRYQNTDSTRGEPRLPLFQPGRSVFFNASLSF